MEIKNASTALYVSDKVMSRQNNFNEIKKVINSNVDKVFLNVSPGLLYLNSMHNYGSMYYNNAPGLSGYIELIKLTGVPVTAEYIICKEQLSNESSEKINAYFAFYKSLKSNPDTLFDNVNYTVLTMRQE